MRISGLVFVGNVMFYFEGNVTDKKTPNGINKGRVNELQIRFQRTVFYNYVNKLIEKIDIDIIDEAVEKIISKY